jgi:Rrf2 family transcriptional regulator, cysteine metabolism repressor
MSSLITVSQKCKYALRAVFELSLRYPSENVSTLADIAQVQGIPPRFLEQIFSKLKSGGYIQAQRGHNGGYLIANRPSKITLGEIIRLIEGDELSIKCNRNPDQKQHQLQSNCVFKGIWRETREQVAKIFESKTFQDLIDQHKKSADVLDYII